MPVQGGNFPGRGQGGNASGGTSGNMLFGTIKEIGDGALVMTDTNGKETRVKVTDTTLIEKNSSVKLADLDIGETLMVSGSTAADGNVTARSIQVAPQGRFGPGGAASDGQGAPQARPTPAQ